MQDSAAFPPDLSFAPPNTLRIVDGRVAFELVVAAFVGGAGLSALLGWATGVTLLTSFGSGSQMRAVGALCFVLSAAALALAATGRLAVVMRASAGGAMLIALYTLVSGPGPDGSAGLTWTSGMPSGSSINFLLLNASLVARSDAAPARFLRLTAALVALLIALLATLSYIGGVNIVLSLFPRTGVALPTAFCFLAFSAGVVSLVTRDARSSIKARAGFGFGVGFFLLSLLVALAVFAASLQYNAVALGVAITHTQARVTAAQMLLSATRDAETGQRGFLYTGKTDYLAPYTAAVADTPARLAELRRLAADDSVQSARVEAIAVLVDEKFAELGRTVALKQSGADEAARAIVNTDAGKAAMDAIRRNMGAMIDADRTQLATQRAQARRSDLLTFVTGLAALLVTIAAALVIGRDLQRRNQRLGALAEQLSTSNAALEHRVTERTAALSASEQALKTSADRLSLSLEAAQMGMWDWDLRTDDVVYNEEEYRLLGVDSSIGPPTGAWFFEFILPEDREALAAHIEAAKVAPGEFTSEFRVTRRDGAVRWLAARGRTSFDDEGRAARMRGVNYDITDRKESEEHIQFLMREMAHRAKNALSLVQAIASQTARSTSTQAAFLSRFSERLQALASSHDVIALQKAVSAPIDDLVRRHVGFVASDDRERFVLDGPPARLDAAAAQAVGLALHELATNAVKYGALSSPQGTVAIEWALSAEQDLELVWRERNGPPVAPPERKGFGHVVIERMAARSVGGRSALTFAPDGVVWTMNVPAAHLTTREDA